LKEAFNSKDTRRYQNGVDDGRVAAEKERDAALKACAEMRAAMARVADFAHHAEDCAKWSDFRGAECDCGAKGARNDVDHALSSNAGKGYLSPTEADALKEAVREACAVEGAQRCMRGDVRSPARLPDEVAKAIRSLDLAAILKEG
ncbi:MAG: hypothetical protein KGI71_05800, partial [Patescibacteria group bacterium]|nr:hypothetical protein [Patescibacteria group bacterium]